MLRLTLAQMRRSIGRLTAAGIAIVISTAFVAATLIAGAVITRTSYDAVAASYADADLVVTARGFGPDGLTDADLGALRATSGVGAVDGRLLLSTEVVACPKRAYPTVTAVASDPRLEVQTRVSGSFPTGPGDVAVPGPLAERLGVGLGDTLTASRSIWTPTVPAADDASTTDPTAADAGTWVESAEQLTVVGLLDDPAGAYAQSGGAVVIEAATAARWAADDTSGEPATYGSAVVALVDGVDVEAARSALEAAAPSGATIRTKDEQAASITAELTGGADVFTPIVLGFAAIALLVAALVIANTFQVLIAQRTRTLALLRCVGAGKRQLRQSVLIEAGLLGAAASALGLAVGVGLAQLTLSVLGSTSPGVPLPATVSMTPAVVLAPLVAGTLVTVLAALAPARAATRVAPLAALRPAGAPAVNQRRNRPRLVAASVLTIGGGALLVLAVISTRSIDTVIALGLGVLGGALSFLGVLVGSVFWVPRVVGAAGRLFAGTGTPATLAAANTVRNPRRTAATSTALLIGVTLVTMMSTGAASARSTLNNALDDQYPVDVMIGRDVAASTPDDAEGSLVTPTLVGTVAAVPGVGEVVALRHLGVRLGARGGDDDQAVYVGAVVLTADDAATVLRVPSMVAGLRDEAVIVAAGTATDLGIVDGDVVTVADTAVGADGLEVVVGSPIELNARVTDLPGGVAITPAALARMAVELPTNLAWVRLTDVSEAGSVVPDIEDALSETAVQISGAGVERAQYQRIIDTLLAVVVGLLAAAVVIALIGVANTLSLSVIERRRESATLRALGLTRRQLRGTLAIEGMLIAGVGAVLGAALGTLYGWAGAATVLGVIGDVRLQVPWRDLALVVLVALAAGLLASVVPGRSAARTSPVAALGVE